MTADLAPAPLSRPDHGRPEYAGRRALVVDDQATNRLILRARLRTLGFKVQEAANGREAIDAFDRERPDIVFMDVMMPGMDGFEATRAIKLRAGDDFVPVIFLTALVDEESLIRCVDSGGDDFLTKPYSLQMLEAKMRALDRTRAAHERTSRLFRRLRREEEVAEAVFTRAVAAGNLECDGIRYFRRAAATFSGDVMLTARAPSGEIHALLGDFTGHGLSAAIGALPASEAFRAMTSKGFAPAQIMEGINRKLNGLLPTGMFMAGVFVAVDQEEGAVRAINCGMPDALLLDADTARIAARIPSTALALGILPDIALDDAVAQLPLREGMRVLMRSDGLTESRSPDGECFGEPRVGAVVGGVRGAGAVFSALIEALDAHLRDEAAHDDVSLLEIRRCPALRPHRARAGASERAGGRGGRGAPRAADASRCSFSMSVGGARLARVDPVPMMLGHLLELEALGDHRAALFTVLTELYVNALDHGVLGLDSGLKRSAQGFAGYLEERNARLAALDSGAISIDIELTRDGGARSVLIRVGDSGAGFDLEGDRAPRDARPALYGRGLPLVRALCSSVEFEAPGNVVEARFDWSC